MARTRTGYGTAKLVHIPLVLGAVVMVTPFVWQLLTSFKSFGESLQVPPTILPRVWEVSNYLTVFQRLPFLSMFVVTVLSALGRLVGVLLLASMAAYGFSRLRFRGRNVLFVVFLSVLMVPTELFILPQYEIMLKLGWLNSIQALIVPHIYSVFGVFLLRQFFLTLPADLDDAARIDGANPWRIFWNVILPLAQPGLMALGILTVLASWKDLLWPLIVNTDAAKMPFAAGLAALNGEFFTNYPVLMAGAAMAMIPLVVIFMVMQRQVIQGIAFSGSKG